jgi:hypothetical protein
VIPWSAGESVLGSHLSLNFKENCGDLGVVTGRNAQQNVFGDTIYFVSTTKGAS